MKRASTLWSAALLGLALLAGCNGGGGDGTPAPQPPPEGLAAAIAAAAAVPTNDTSTSASASFTVLQDAGLRLLAQLRMSERGDTARSAEVSQRLAQDLLFFCAQAASPGDGRRVIDQKVEPIMSVEHLLGKRLDARQRP